MGSVSGSLDGMKFAARSFIPLVLIGIVGCAGESLGEDGGGVGDGGSPPHATPPRDASSPGDGSSMPGACEGKPRVGDPGSVYDPSLDDERYPMMKEWAKAGVQGGIPQVAEVAVTLGPEDGLDAIQAAIDQLAVTLDRDRSRPETFRVILLRKCRYEIHGGDRNPILEVKPGVILRGESRDETILSFTTSRDGHEYDFSIALRGWAGLENLTVTNQYVETLDESEYVGNFSNTEATGVGARLSGVTLQRDNSWVQGTRITKVGTHPVFIGGAKHCTLRENIVEKALNKGGGGRGYYYIANNSAYILVYRDVIADLRHFTYLMGVNHNVVLSVSTAVDLSFHNKPEMFNNLFEGIDSRIPDSHRWGKGASWGFGWYTVALTRENHNVVYKMTTLPGYPATKAYIIRRYWDDPEEQNGHAFEEIPEPRGGTFYPVTGCREPPPLLVGEPT